MCQGVSASARKFQNDLRFITHQGHRVSGSVRERLREGVIYEGRVVVKDLRVLKEGGGRPGATPLR